MNWTPELRLFIRQHVDDNTDRLLLSAKRYPDIDVREAVEQILARRQLRYKLPEWYALSDNLIMGGRIAAEQCSSEQTARYKQQLVVGSSLCDLTGGMGVDFYYMSRGLNRAIYTERQHHLVEAIAHNVQVLDDEKSHPEYTFREGDGRVLEIPQVDTLYLDPARRATDGSRVYDLCDCEPNVVVWQDELLSHCKRLIIKISPMADLSRVVDQLHAVKEVHILAVKNECKEVLAVLENNTKDINGSLGVKVFCVDFRTSDTIRFDYNLEEEQRANALWASDVQHYLFEPDVTIMKAGAFKLISEKMQLQKLDTSSHIYTSAHCIREFPGRIFEVDEVVPFSSKTLKSMKKDVAQANVSVRNFPLSADVLKKRAGLKDGGDIYLFGTTISSLGAVLIRCHKVLLALLLVMFFMFPATYGWAKKKPKVPVETIESILGGVANLSPSMWHQGMEFYHLNHELSQVLVPEIPSPEHDTISFAMSKWTFDGIISEEDWMGQQKMHLRFASPMGRHYRFNTERLMNQAMDTTYRPIVAGLLPVNQISDVDSLLRARTFFILINDERILMADSLHIKKYVQVNIDSITVGTEQAPLRVWLTNEEGIHVSFLTSLPNSRERTTSTAIHKYLSVADPYLEHPDITHKNWSLIQNSQVEANMTTEEVRLSVGRPIRFERYMSKNGIVERWFYSNGRVLEFWDNRLNRIGYEH